MRLGLPATAALPPMVDWPERLEQTLGSHVYLCHGGHEFNGAELRRSTGDEFALLAADIVPKDYGRSRSRPSSRL